MLATEHKLDKSYRVVITLNGRITAFQAGALREQFAVLSDDGVKYFVLDLSQVEFLDSAGLAALVYLLKHARQEGGDVKMILPKLETAQRILRLTRFDKVFPLEETVETALQSF
jgi:anti-sigma B factor antagonist